jgi:hypothetical protein
MFCAAVGVAALMLASSSGVAQSASAGVAAVDPAASSAKAGAVPSLVSYSGVLKDAAGRTVSSLTGVTFLIYKDPQGGAPLWMETQSVAPDKLGHYSVQLGATSSAGLPSEVFMSGEARWLGVQMAGEAEQARVLLVAVPYAMKAGDAATIGGLPPSAFVLAAPVNGAAASANNTAATLSSSDSAAPPASSNVTTTGGTVNAIPLFTAATNIQNSILTQTGATAINVGGKLNLPALGAATATGGKVSRPESFVASAFNSGTSAAVAQTFQLQAEPVGNNTAAPAGTLNLLYGSGAAAPTETGLRISSKGLLTFATGQTFPGTGAGTITGVTTAAGSGLAGGGTAGTLGLKLLSTCATNQILKWSGTAWACAADANSGGTVTSVGLTAAASDFVVSGSPVTGSGTLNIAWNVPPTDANVFGAIVKRDASGNFRASTITLSNLFVNNTLNANALTANGVTANGVSASGSTVGAPTIQGYANATTGASWGVYGLTNSSASNAYGVVGYATSSTGTPIGTYGVATGSHAVGVFGQHGSMSVIGQGFSYPTGTWGDGGATAGGIGVFGTTDDGTAGLFINNSPSLNPTLDVVNRGGGLANPFVVQGANGGCYIDANGNLNCNGSKNAVVPLDGGKRIVAMSAIEAPQNWFEDAGSGQLLNGVAVVTLDPDFIQTVNAETNYKVFPVPNGDCKGLYITNKTANSFEVRELGGGTSNVAFDYRIMVLRKNYENVRFADRTHDLDGHKRLMERMKNRLGQPAAASGDLSSMVPAAK